MTRKSTQRILTAVTLASPLAMAGSGAFAAVPDSYLAPTLEARTQFADGYNWPRRGQISNLSLNDDGVIGMQGTITGAGLYVYPEDALWYGSVGAGGDIYRDLNVHPGTGLSATAVSPSGVAVNMQRGGTEGLYGYNGTTYSLITSNLGGTPAFNVSTLAMGPTGAIGFVDTSAGGRSIKINTDPGGTDSYTTIYDGVAAGAASISASWSQNLTAAANVTVGGVGQIIRATSTGTVDTIATVDGLNYSSFTSSPDVNSDGHVAFRARRPDSVDVIGYWNGTSLSNVVVEGVPLGGVTFTDLASFSPRINDVDQILFRADNALWVTDGLDVVRVVGVGDAITTDLGATTVSSLGSAYDFNSDATVVTTLGLATGGTGAFSFVVPEPGSLTLLGLAAGLIMRRKR